MRSLLLGLIFTCCAVAAPPYRFLLVAGNQWEDDASFLIERSGEFQITAALLKTWGLPFDILRLDQQTLDRYHLLRTGWHSALRDHHLGRRRSKGRDISLLADLNAQGVSVVILGDTIKDPEIARLAGLRYVSDYKAYDAGQLRRGPFHYPAAWWAARRNCWPNVGYSYRRTQSRSRRRRR